MATAPDRRSSATEPRSGPGAARPLVAGERMSAAEFDRRYRAMPDVKRAELIGGVVYMASPVSDDHGGSHFAVNVWLGRYLTLTPGVSASIDGTLLLGGGDRVQPDVHLRLRPEHGGAARLGGGRFVVGGPELVVEVAVSSADYDLRVKHEVYRINGVQEYIIWRFDDAAIDWLALREGRYEPLAVGEDGLIRSEAFPGLWLDVAALLRGDLPAVSAAVDRGAATPEHAAFAARLAQAAAGGGARP